MGTYFTADLHLGHKNIIEYCRRPFKTVEEMDMRIIFNWNSIIGEKDTVYILGDFSLSGKQQAIEYEYKLKGHKILIRGGHDRFTKCFSETHDYLERKIEGVDFIMCHYPLVQWNKEYYGSVHLHGHNHDISIEEKKNRINVGVDVWDFKPVSVEQIMSML